MSAIDPSLGIRSVELAVGDLQRSAEFYSRVLGLPLISLQEDRGLLGTEAANPALVLSAITDPTPLQRGAAGLYHVAWLHPTRAALAETVRRVAGARWQFDGASDHGVSEALYLSDPDGLGIELYVDRPRERWERPADGRGVKMVTEPLDVADLLAEHPGDPGAEMPAGTVIGHVHMQVSDVPRAEAFYTGALGFEEQAQLPSAAFVSAGGYHHHLGLNSWQSRGAGRGPDSAPGLRRVQFALGGEDAVEAVGRSLADAGAEEQPLRGRDGSLAVLDPDGQLLEFSAR
jgi:catechol 2,3-dioxygenase